MIKLPFGICMYIIVNLCIWGMLEKLLVVKFYWFFKFAVNIFFSRNSGFLLIQNSDFRIILLPLCFVILRTRQIKKAWSFTKMISPVFLAWICHCCPNKSFIILLHRKQTPLGMAQQHHRIPNNDTDQSLMGIVLVV